MKNTIKECAAKYQDSEVKSKINNCVNRYRQTLNISNNKIDSLKPINQARGKIIADYFSQLEHNPLDTRTSNSYEQLATEVYLQYEFAEYCMGIKFEPWFELTEPYSSSCEMFADVHDNHHLYFLTTQSGFGEEKYFADNPMLKKTGKQVQGYEILINDMFRAIHDLFGHAMKGYGFSAIGEEKAWYEHIQLFSFLARPALTTETRGQSCWVNYGFHLRNENGKVPKLGQPGYIPLSQRPFAKQKAGLLPPEVSGVTLTEIDGEIFAHSIKDWNPNLEQLDLVARQLF